MSQSTLPKADARMAVAAAYGVDAPPDELKKIIGQVATEIHGLYVMTSSPEHPEYDPLRLLVNFIHGQSVLYETSSFVLFSHPWSSKKGCRKIKKKY